MKIYNGENMILGRLAAQVAKEALMGEEIAVVNCEKVIISGSKTKVIANEKAKRDRKGYPLKSAKFTRLPDRMVRRTIRGMLPFKQERGRTAFKRIMCYVGVPPEFEGKELLSAAHADMKKLPTLKYITIGEIAKQLGGKQ